MKIDRATLQKIAHLARLEMDESHEQAMIKDMEEILTWVEKLNELDTEGVEPVTHMSQEVNVFRDDQPHDQLDQDKALKNAPKKDDKYFRVPKFLE